MGGGQGAGAGDDPGPTQHSQGKKRASQGNCTVAGALQPWLCWIPRNSETYAHSNKESWIESHVPEKLIIPLKDINQIHNQGIQMSMETERHHFRTSSIGKNAYFYKIAF